MQQKQSFCAFKHKSIIINILNILNKTRPNEKKTPFGALFIFGINLNDE